MAIEAKLVEELRELKSKIEEVKGWLAKLEEKKDSVKPEVYERVKIDYQNRLASLNEKAAELLPQLESEVSALKSKLSEISAKKDDLDSSLEELKLRHELGELDDDEFEERSAKLTDEIKGLEAEEKELVASVEEFEEILQGFEREPAKEAEAPAEEKAEPAAEPEPEPEPAPEPAPEPEPEVAQPQEAEEAPQAVAEKAEEEVKAAEEKAEPEKAEGEPVDVSTIGEILEEIEEQKGKAEEPAPVEEPPAEAEPLDLGEIAEEVTPPESTSEPQPSEYPQPSLTASLTNIPGPKVVYSDGQREVAVSIDAKTTVIGSSDDADVVLKFEGVAPRHAEIVRKRDRFILRDLGSPSGTYVSGQRIKGKIELNHLDVIKVGSVELKVFLED